MLRPFTPHTHSFRPVRHAWRVITDPYDKMPMCDAARSLIGVLSPGSRHAPVDHGHTHTGLAISGQRGGDGHASIVCMAPIGTLTRAGTAKQLPAGRVTAPGCVACSAEHVWMAESQPRGEFLRFPATVADQLSSCHSLSPATAQDPVVGRKFI